MHAIEVHMQMHQIRHFLALCEECNFTRAAKWSGITQPSLTNAISALERESGGALFQRKRPYGARPRHTALPASDRGNHRSRLRGGTGLSFG